MVYGSGGSHYLASRILDIVGVIIWNIGVAVQQRKGTLTNIGF